MKKIVIIFILVIAAILSLKNLGNIYLWEDEAETAVIAKNVLIYGYPSPWDMKNLVTQQNGQDIAIVGNHYLWRWHPWLQYYVLAPFLKIFGRNAFAARLPFVLFGLGTIYLIYLIARRLFNERAAIFAILFATLSWPYLVYIRQARYYALVLFFTSLVIYFYLDFLEKRKNSWVWFSLAAILLFHSNFVAFLGTILGLLLHFLIFNSRNIKEYLTKIALVLLVVSLFTLPWFFVVDYFSIKQQGVTFYSFLRSGKFYLKNINDYIFPLVVFIGFFFFIKSIYQHRKEISLLVVTASTIVITAAITISYPYTRYVVGVFPLLFILAGVLFDWLMKKDKLFVMFIPVIILSNFFNQLPNFLLNPRYYQKITLDLGLFSYLYEINHNYDGPVEAIVNYINKHKNENTTVLTNYAWEPIIFHSDAKVINRIYDKNSKLYKLTEDQNPQFIIPRQCWGQMQIPENYRKIELPQKDICWENREEPSEHLFMTTVSGPNVVLFEKK